jgi:Gamma-glutamyl cyclotransferase, AIG2-like
MSEPRRVDVFFYGLFMDAELLRQKGISPENPRVASVKDFRLVIGNRATLIPCATGMVHGLLFSLTQHEIAALYSEPSVAEYRPETISAITERGIVPALCFNLPSTVPCHERNFEYATRLKALAERIGLPQSYVDSI